MLKNCVEGVFKGQDKLGILYSGLCTVDQSHKSACAYSPLYAQFMKVLLAVLNTVNFYSDDLIGWWFSTLSTLSIKAIT